MATSTEISVNDINFTEASIITNRLLKILCENAVCKFSKTNLLPKVDYIVVAGELGGTRIPLPIGYEYACLGTPMCAFFEDLLNGMTSQARIYSDLDSIWLPKRLCEGLRAQPKYMTIVGEIYIGQLRKKPFIKFYGVWWMTNE